MVSRMKRLESSRRVGKISKLSTIKSRKRLNKLYDIDELFVKIVEDILTTGKPIYFIPHYLSYHVGYRNGFNYVH